MYKTPNGDLIYPNKGTIPSNPDESKYQRDEHNPFVFHLKLPDCNQRLTITKTVPRCLKTITANKCLVTKEIVDYVDCHICTIDNEIRQGPKLKE